MKNNQLVKPFTAAIDRLASGEAIELPANTMKDRKHLSFTCDFDDIGDGVIKVGHGIHAANGSWVEITKEKIGAYSYYTYGGENNGPRNIAIHDDVHGIEIKSFVTVKIDLNAKGEGTTVTLMSAGGMYRSAIKGWNGTDGKIGASPVDLEITNCKLSWYSDCYSESIWFIGDSYLGYGYGARWPYYLYRDGYTKLLLTGYAGMGTQRGLTEFKLAITKGTPEFVVWCLGMNNGDNRETGVINQGWLDSTKEFLKICKERGITPILSTIPNTPKVYNQPKNDWVIASGYRYVDFNRAVGADKDENWYPGMLFTDLVHPDVRGAQALYSQVLVDFPEVMQA